MERRTQNRTPKRLLSVFLSILMVLSAVVVGNPFVVEAVEQSSYVNWKANVSSSMLEASHESRDFVGCDGYNYDLFEDGYDVDRKPSTFGTPYRNCLFYVYSIYDYSPYAKNYDTVVSVNNSEELLDSTFWMGDEIFFDLTGKYDRELRYNPSNGSCDPDAKTSTYYTTENKFSTSGYSDLPCFTPDDCYKPGQDFPSGSWLYVKSYSTHQSLLSYDEDEDGHGDWNYVQIFPGIITYAVNTQRVSEYYDLAMSKYGKTNKYYTAESWNRYIEAVAAAENIINGNLHLKVIRSKYDAEPRNIYDPQAEINAVWTELRDAINALVALPTNITYVNNVEGAKVEGPSTATSGNNISVTLRLEVSHSKSPDAGVNIRYADGTSKNFTVKSSGSRNGNTITLTIPLEGFEPTITPINIVKNTYKVTLQNGAGGLQVLDDKGGKEFHIQHNGSFEFRIMQLPGYTNGEPKVYVRNSNHLSPGIGQVAGVDQGNNVYKYTITGVAVPLPFEAPSPRE